MIRARVKYERLVTPQRLDPRVAPKPPLRSHEMVVACGHLNRYGHQTYRGIFGSIFEEAPIQYGGAPGRMVLRLDAIFRFEPTPEDLATDESRAQAESAW